MKFSGEFQEYGIQKITVANVTLLNGQQCRGWGGLLLSEFTCATCAKRLQLQCHSLLCLSPIHSAQDSTKIAPDK
jgi:hypothetical protein